MKNYRFARLTASLRKNGLFVALVVVLGMFFGLSISVFQPAGGPVQAAVVTPIAQTGREDSRIATFFYAETISADTRRCFDLADMEIMDLQYQVDATNANTTTVTFQQTNINPINGPFNSAQAVATVISTDANTFSQVGLFGQWNCVFLDVTNSQPISFTIIGVAK